MIKKFIVALSVIGLIFAGSPVVAGINAVPAYLSTPGTSRDLLLPEAADHASVIYLGQAIDPVSGKIVEGIAFIHYKKEFGKNNNNGRKPGGNSSPVCYSFLSKGAKWKTPEDYIFDANNTEGLSQTTLKGLLFSDMGTWDNEVTANIFGSEIAGVVDGVDTSAPDGKNEVMFGSVSSPGVIAVTTVWGIFRGRSSDKELLEWDMIFNESDFDWSAEVGGIVGKMDFSNIATHELGHAAGMGHPDNSCADETMYAYADFSETKKRDLYAGDITGIKELYK